jgi:hypothetical protein
MERCLKESECHYALTQLTWQIGRSKVAGRLGVASHNMVARAQVGHLANCLQPAKPYKDCRAAYEKRLVQAFPVCRPTIKSVSCPLSIKPLLSCILPAHISRIILDQRLRQHSLNLHHHSAGYPSHVSLNRTLTSGSPSRWPPSGVPGQQPSGLQTAACAAANTSSTLSDLHLLACLVIVRGRHVADDWL